MIITTTAAVAVTATVSENEVSLPAWGHPGELLGGEKFDQAQSKRQQRWHSTTPAANPPSQAKLLARPVRSTKLHRKAPASASGKTVGEPADPVGFGQAGGEISQHWSARKTNSGAIMRFECTPKRQAPPERGYLAAQKQAARLSGCLNVRRS